MLCIYKYESVTVTAKLITVAEPIPLETQMLPREKLLHPSVTDEPIPRETQMLPREVLMDPSVTDEGIYSSKVLLHYS